MMFVIWATVNSLPTVVSTGTSGDTPPWPRAPWHCEHAKRTKSWAPAATCGDTLGKVGCGAAAGAACVVPVLLPQYHAATAVAATIAAIASTARSTPAIATESRGGRA